MSRAVEGATRHEALLSRWRLASVRARLIAGYVVLGTAVTGIGLLTASSIYGHSEARRRERAAIRSDLSALAALANSATEESFSYALFHDPEERERASTKSEDACRSASRVHLDLGVVPAYASVADAIRADACHFRDVEADVLASVDRDGTLSPAIYPIFEASIDTLTERVAELDAIVHGDAERDRVESGRHATELMILVGALSIALAALLGRQLAESVAGPLHRLSDALRTFGHGNLEATVDVGSNDELGQLALAFRDMASRTREHVQALDRAKLHLADIFASMEEVLVVRDAGGLIRSVNPACLILSGYAEAELLGQPDSLLFTELPTSPSAGIKVTRSRGESMLKTKDDRRIPVRLSIAGLRSEKGGTVLVAQNLTERQRLARELRQAQKMDAIGRLAGGVAHDFNNMLSVILGYSGMLLEGMEVEDPSYEGLSEIQNAGQRSLELTQQLLAFSRRRAPESVVVDASAVIETTTRMIKRTLGASIELGLVKPDVPLYVRTEAGQLDNMVMNLVLNARDALPNGGRVDVSLAAAEIGAGGRGSKVDLSPGTYVHLCVADNGIGMDSRTMSQIFEPFFTTKPEGAGTGLGLATAFGIVERSGGRISVDSEVGRGTSFHVYLPLVTAEAAPASGTTLRLRGAA